jgi:hypothetical protein
MNLKSEIAKRIGVAITISSFWSLYNLGLQIMAIIVIIVLVGSCVVLPFRERLSKSRWRKLAEASMLEITFAALGLGTVTSGARLVSSGSVWWGIGYILAGGLFIGAGLGENVSTILKRKSTS